MALKVMFAWLLTIGMVEPMNEDNEGRELYYLYVLDEQKGVHVFDYAYEEEIMNYIVTGEFQYNEAITAEELLTNNK